MTEVVLFVLLGAAMVLGTVGWVLRPGFALRSGPRPDRVSSVALLAGVPLVVALLYAGLGRIDALRTAPLDPVRAMAEDRTASLAARLATTPDDIDGLRLLARSYEQLGRFGEAVTARTRLVALRPDDIDALVDLADARSMLQGGSYTGDPIELVRRALKADPDNDRALASLANDAAERGDLPAAMIAWRRILEHVPADSAVARSLRDNLARAEAGPPADGPATGPTR